MSSSQEVVETTDKQVWPGDVIARKDWWAAWGTIAANSFGGPAGQIAVMHDEIVERRGWVGERRFLHALNYCMLLPGPEAQQLATYLGWLLRGPSADSSPERCSSCPASSRSWS